MPVRATKRGAERTPLSGDYDVIVCGASFAGLAVARELRATPARVLVVDRYEIGERQTSACAAPTAWLENMGLAASIRQTFDSLVVHTPNISARWPLPWSFATFDYRHLCELLWGQCDALFETAKVDGCTRVSPHDPRKLGSSGDVTIHTDRGDLRAPLIVDALGWRRVLSNGPTIQPPDARLSRGLEVHPEGTSPDLELWLDPRFVSPGYGWSFPAGDEVRVGVGSFDPRLHVKDPTLDLVGEVGRTPDGWQGNWIPHWLRPATEDGVFFAGDSAGHCLPLSAEGIRTALYFGVAAGRELRHVLEGRQDVTTALRRYHEFSEAHAWKFRWMFRVQQSVKYLHGAPANRMLMSFASPRLTRWAFNHYLNIAPPAFALPAPAPARRKALSAAAA